MKKTREKLAFLAIIPVILLTAVFWPKMAVLEPFNLNSLQTSRADYDVSITAKRDKFNFSAEYPNTSYWYGEKNIIEDLVEMEIEDENSFFYAVASWYGPGFHGRQMANGQIFDMHNEAVVAHKNLAFGTKVEIVNPSNNSSIIATVKDRGPYIPGRDFDLSFAGAEKLGMVEKGVAKLKVRIIE